MKFDFVHPKLMFDQERKCKIYSINCSKKFLHRKQYLLLVNLSEVFTRENEHFPGKHTRYLVPEYIYLDMTGFTFLLVFQRNINFIHICQAQGMIQFKGPSQKDTCNVM